MTESIRELDLHGKRVHQARTAINAALSKSAGLYRLRLIHGHNSGTALRDMIWDEFSQNPRVLRLVRINDGTTDLVLREF